VVPPPPVVRFAFWTLALAAALPLAASIASVLWIVESDDFRSPFDTGPDVTLKDQWMLVMSTVDLPPLLMASALAVLALAAATFSGRPRWAVHRHSESVVGGLAAVSALWSVVTALMTLWAAYGPLTQEQERYRTEGFVHEPALPEVLPDVALAAVLFGVEALVAVLLLRRASHQWFGDDALEGASAE